MKNKVERGSGMFKRVIWIILDSVGIGELPDADLLEMWERHIRTHF